MQMQVSLKADTRMVKVTITKEEERLFFQFPFNKPLMAEIKEMEGAKYHGYDEHNPRKIWSIKDCDRNRFQLAYLANPGGQDPKNPYFDYDKPLVKLTALPRTLYQHQLDLVAHGLTRHYCIFAAEMGTGKTLSAITLMELSNCHNWVWVGPKSALVSVKLEFKKWGSKITPIFVTYDGLKKMMTEWPAGKPAPHGVIFDESSRLKNPTAQRTIAARHLANSIRSEHGKYGYVILMSGSPAPKSPVDWWSQCEIAQPGFLKEGTLEKCKRRLAIIETRNAFEGGGSYPHLVTWKDDERKCNVCGLLPDDETHTAEIDVHASTSTCHKYEPSKNEIHGLYQRMSGLVMVKFKKDCLDLPEKIYRLIELKPTRSILNAASAIVAKSSSSIQANLLLRELSDGFQYTETKDGEEQCPLCKGCKLATEVYDTNRPDDTPSPEEFEKGRRYDETECDFVGPAIVAGTRNIACYHCSATGVVAHYTRGTTQIPTPKEDALRELLDEHDDVGRLVIYGGFTGSIERIVAICRKAQWDFIKVDGHGWATSLPATSAEGMINIFQNQQERHARVAFIGQPGAAGMGLTLTASPTIVYYSNDFNAESRIQSEDRIHRVGMNKLRGATIVDLVHLPSDQLVLNNLKKKRKLQDVSMGELQSLIAQAEQSLEREF